MATKVLGLRELKQATQTLLLAPDLAQHPSPDLNTRTGPTQLVSEAADGSSTNREAAY